MTTTDTKATPRPWRYKESRENDCQGQIHAVLGPVHPVDGGDYAPLARLSKKANAALIVRAVNEYDALKEIERVAKFLWNDGECYCMSRSEGGSCEPCFRCQLGIALGNNGWKGEKPQ